MFHSSKFEEKLKNRSDCQVIGLKSVNSIKIDHWVQVTAKEYVNQAIDEFL